MPALIAIIIILGFLIGVYALYMHFRVGIRKMISYIDVFAHLDRIAPRSTVQLSNEVKDTYVKVVVFVPDAHAEKVRNAIGESGGGRVGNYSFVTFSSAGIGRYKPEQGAHPSIGEVGKLESVEEERIEFTVSNKNLDKVITAIKKVHPYEEQVIDIYPIGSI